MIIETNCSQSFQKAYIWISSNSKQHIHLKDAMQHFLSEKLCHLLTDTGTCTIVHSPRLSNTNANSNPTF